MSIYGNPVMLGGSGGGGGGSTNVLSGTTMPTAAQGNNGAMYLNYFSSGANITNVRMVIHAVRNSGSDTQVAEVQLYDANGSVISWSAGTGTSNGNVYSSSQTPDKAFDNITNDKWYTNSQPSLQSPIWIDFAPNTPIPANSVKGWGWYTGDDSSNRDPKTFDLLMSFDGGNTYVVIDSVVDATVTTNRNTLAYTKELSTIDGAVIGAYAKVNGAWQNLIGTDINGIDLGGGGESDAPVSTVAVVDNSVVSDGLTITAQPAIVDGEMSATSSLGLAANIVPDIVAVIEMDYTYNASSTARTLFSFGGSNTNTGILGLDTGTFQFYGNGRDVNTSISMSAGTPHHLKIEISATDIVLYIDGTLAATLTNAVFASVLSYLLDRSKVTALLWNQSWHGEYNTSKVNNLSIKLVTDQ